MKKPEVKQHLPEDFEGMKANDIDCICPTICFDVKQVLESWKKRLSNHPNFDINKLHEAAIFRMHFVLHYMGLGKINRELDIMITEDDKDTLKKGYALLNQYAATLWNFEDALMPVDEFIQFIETSKNYR